MNAPTRDNGFFTESLSSRDPELYGSITSELGRGTRFTLRFPREDARLNLLIAPEEQDDAQ